MVGLTEVARRATVAKEPASDHHLDLVENQRKH